MGKPEQRDTKTTPKKSNNKRINVPVVIQMEAVECGAAALAMVLAYYGRIVSLEEARIECGVSRDGSMADNMVKAARKYGLVANGYRIEPEDLTSYKLPLIIFWDLNHFIVLTGKKGSRYFINDPTTGVRIVSPEEFDESFSGIILTFEPGKDFEKGGYKKSIFLSLWRRLTGMKKALLYVLLVGLLLVLPGLLIPVFSRVFLDDILVDKQMNWTRPLVLIMGLTLCVVAILTWLQQAYLMRIELKLSISSSVKFFRHLFRLPIQFFYQRCAGELQNRIYLNDRVATLLSGPVSTNFLSLFMIAFYAILMYRYDVILASVSVFIAFLNLAALIFVSHKREVMKQTLQSEEGKLIGGSMSGLQLIETLKASGSEADFFSRWAGYQARVITMQQKMQLSTVLLSAVPAFLSSLNMVLILCFGSLRIMAGLLTIGMLSAFQMLMQNFSKPINDMVGFGSELQEVRADLDKLDDVLSNEEDEQMIEGEEAKDIEDPPKLRGYLELKNVMFGYSRLAPPVIDNFSLSLKPGERVALVGHSGCGKSTISKIVAGLYHPWDGEALFDGKKRIAYSKDVMHNSVSIVDQDIFLFESTIVENLTMWDHTINMDSVILAAKDAHIHDDITYRPGAYDSMVGEGGRNFSGGQRQRLEIARALATNPSILILDEATSALDPVTEKAIDDNVRRRGWTCLIVAHRLSTIRDCNEIIVLDKGKVVERGTHGELIDKKGHYHNLITSQ